MFRREHCLSHGDFGVLGLELGRDGVSGVNPGHGGNLLDVGRHGSRARVSVVVIGGRCGLLLGDGADSTLGARSLPNSLVRGLVRGRRPGVWYPPGGEPRVVVEPSWDLVVLGVEHNVAGVLLEHRADHRLVLKRVHAAGAVDHQPADLEQRYCPAQQLEPGPPRPPARPPTRPQVHHIEPRSCEQVAACQTFSIRFQAKSSCSQRWKSGCDRVGGPRKAETLTGGCGAQDRS